MAQGIEGREPAWEAHGEPIPPGAAASTSNFIGNFIIISYIPKPILIEKVGKVRYNNRGENPKNGENIMNNPSHSQYIDLSAGLGYGLIYQPIIGSSSSPDYPFAKNFFFYHRRKLHRREDGMRRSTLAE